MTYRLMQMMNNFFLIMVTASMKAQLFEEKPMTFQVDIW